MAAKKKKKHKRIHPKGMKIKGLGKGRGPGRPKKGYNLGRKKPRTAKQNAAWVRNVKKAKAFVAKYGDTV